MRTLLLTDLCDSTGLVERLGDPAAAALFRDHDRLVLDLQQRWHGRLIDRSDGLLLLFERPIDGLGFALDYRRGLEALGRTHRAGPLRARAGLHVGELLIWRNSEEAVDAGAKQVEVEGLAKSFTARLMQLARPGQILLSSVAEPLARRAARELGERGETLQWRAHGRWRFKGVPQAQALHEVGERGLAPLRMPRGDGKAWRDVPLWRRPAALVAEALMLAACAAVLWLTMRAEPVVAFNERDWVVLGDLRNLTGQTVLDESLQQAFRIGLEQSRHVNVLGELKVEQTLRRMGRDPLTTAVDRKVGAEVAIRDGARLLLLPMVSEVGGNLRISVEVVDPENLRTLLVESADGRGLDSALASIDKVVSGLRQAFGEGLDTIRKDHVPLPDVTTSNLEALRAYALALAAHGRADYREAKGLLERAVQLDPDFALAYIGLLRTNNALVDAAGGLDALERAIALKDRLPPREQLYIDAWDAEMKDPVKALEKWVLVSRLYPDSFIAQINAGLGLKIRNRYQEALHHADASASRRNGLLGLSWNLVGSLRLAMENYEGAHAAFVSATEEGSLNAPLGIAIVLAAQRRLQEADAVFNTGMPRFPVPRFDRVSILLDAGRWEEAEREALRIHASLDRNTQRHRASFVPLAVAHWANDNHERARAALREAVDRNADLLIKEQVAGVEALEATYILAAAGLMAHRLGARNIVHRASMALKRIDSEVSGLPAGSLAIGLDAALRLEEGRPDDALTLLEPVCDGSEPLQVRLLLAETLLEAGLVGPALEHLRWVASHRGRAYAEHGCGYCQQPLNVYETTLARLWMAEVLLLNGRLEDAQEELRQFDAAWPSADLPSQLRKRRSWLLGTLSTMGDMLIAD